MKDDKEPPPKKSTINFENEEKAALQNSKILESSNFYYEK